MSADPSDPEEYRNSRIRYIEEQREKGKNPFPHKFHVSISVPKYHEKYGHLEPKAVDTSVVESVAGLFYLSFVYPLFIAVIPVSNFQVVYTASESMETSLCSTTSKLRMLSCK